MKLYVKIKTLNNQTSQNIYELHNYDNMKTNINTIDWTRVNNDVNGNPRYVCHFLNFIKDADSLDLKVGRHPHNNDLQSKYELALKRARTIGGRKFHNKQYGGGIVFQSYNLADTEQSILNLSK